MAPSLCLVDADEPSVASGATCEAGSGSGSTSVYADDDEIAFARGDKTSDLAVIGKTKERGTTVSFKPDAQIFEITEFSFDTLAQRPRRGLASGRR